MMASHTPDHGRASALPLSAVLASIPSYPRPVVERLVAKLIDHLNEQDGDIDLEDDDPAEDGDGQRVDSDGDLMWIYVPAGQCEDDEDEHDAEIETWAHPDDHPAELHIGRRTPARQLRDD